MDLGLKGRTALLCAASMGIGRACAEALAAEGVDVVLVARNRERLEKTVGEIRARYAVKVTGVAGDIATVEGRSAALSAVPQPDILVTNSGGPPLGDFRNWQRDDWIKALEANMLAPIELIKATVDAMIAQKFGRIVNITSSVVKSPIELLGLSAGARMGLTGFVAGLARETVAHNVTINNLLPGATDTERMRSNMEVTAKVRNITYDTLFQQRVAGIPAGRFGTPQEMGALCAFLCSAQAGFITGQNILADGGAFPGTL